MNIKELQTLIEETITLQDRLDNIIETMGVYEEDNMLFISKNFTISGEVGGEYTFTSFELSNSQSIRIIEEMIDKLHNNKLILKNLGVEIELNPTPFINE